MDLLFDTETTGLPARGMDPMHSAFPHILQFAIAMRERSTGRLVSAVSLLVLPDHPFEIHPRAQEVHGITREQVEMYGISAAKALNLFRLMAHRAERLIAFHIAYDWSLIEALAYRSNVGLEQLPSAPRWCAMTAATPLCKLSPTERMIAAGRGNQYKSPSLQEAYRTLVNPAGFDKAHDAFADVQAMNEILSAMERHHAS